ncbi:hypothetical protein AVEN_227179-1 [Araneus ventricosus]|uniref:Uncharacterized protein n=1 Tax=Araneus ventricosus TaxID=182803 RepID=A0A4Y2BVK7_ARAVE|nr:hypothetical protein AVEN_227179-1 [Araneus ventricosus]
MDDTTMHIQLSVNSRLSCTSLQHTDSPPTHLIVQMVSSTHAFRFGYLGFRVTIAACELKHRSGKPLFTFSYTKYTKRKYCNRHKTRTRDFDESPRFRPP